MKIGDPICILKAFYYQTGCLATLIVDIDSADMICTAAGLTSANFSIVYRPEALKQYILTTASLNVYFTTKRR